MASNCLLGKASPTPPSGHKTFPSCKPSFFYTVFFPSVIFDQEEHVGPWEGGVSHLYSHIFLEAKGKVYCLLGTVIRNINLIFFFFFGGGSFLAAPQHMELLGQGLDWSRSHDLSRSCSSTGSLTHCAALGVKPASQWLPLGGLIPLHHGRIPLNQNFDKILSISGIGFFY